MGVGGKLLSYQVFFLHKLLGLGVIDRKK